MTTTTANRAQYQPNYTPMALGLLLPERPRLRYSTYNDLNPSFAWNNEKEKDSGVTYLDQQNFDRFTQLFVDLLTVAQCARVNDHKCLVISPMRFTSAVWSRYENVTSENMYKNMTRAIDMVIDRLGYQQVYFFWCFVYSEFDTPDKTPNDLVIWCE